MVIVGIDEVGRGCWAGPLVAGAVILAGPIVGLRDSKKLSKRQRERLAIEIQANALMCGLGWVAPPEIDDLGLTASVRLAMQRALDEISYAYDELIIDGNYNFFSENPKAKTLIRADDLIPEVSAASIIAKVARDNFMADMDVQYPGYGFKTNVGYGTLLHRSMLKLQGISPIHRRFYAPIKLQLEGKHLNGRA